MRIGLSLVMLSCSVWAAPLRAEPAAPTPSGTRQAYTALIRQEAARAGLPFDVADAVMAIESGYDPTRIGRSGEIGLMQIMPATAAQLGFAGTTIELAKPATNIHYGVVYLAEAWRRANGDLCRALMKYRAGHAEESMSPLSVTYCAHARLHLAGLGSSFAGAPLAVATVGGPKTTAVSAAGVPKLNTSLKGAAFWAVQEARIRVLRARVERRWSRMASR